MLRGVTPYSPAPLENILDARLGPLYEIFKLNSRLFLNCLDGLTDERAAWRANDDVNSAAFIALHLADTRHYIARLVGAELDNPFAAITKGRRSIAEMKGMPALEEVRDEWKRVTGEIRVRMGQLDAAALDKDSGSKMGLDDNSILGVLTFLMQHDSYHIGQLSLLRKQLGLPAMSYK
jgi:uncharacterized damage-inducible protein DinB